jgi:nicotinate-nucleotide adenylyltransferase
MGHLACAQEAHAVLALDQVVLVPVGEAPHRTLVEDPGPDLRARLCDLAAGPDPRLRVSRIELDRSGPSYTADTLDAMHADEPDDELFLILGADQAASLGEWHEPERVLELATVAVAEREGMERESVLRRLQGLPGADGIEFFSMPRLDVSSSLVRDRVAAARPIRYLVPDAVAGCIEAERLYRSPSPAPAR